MAAPLRGRFGRPGRRLLWLLAVAAVVGAAPPAADASPHAADLRLVLNLPAHRLDVYMDGDRVRSYTVAIGQRSHPTPVGAYTIPHVEWNPWWHPPARPWARGRSVTPPGPNNPMGRAKIYFRDLYYLHGTPEVGSLGSPASHGCVRMRNEDVIELARLLHRHASPGVSPELLDRLERNPRETRMLALERPVPLELRYELAEVRDGRLKLFPDVYRRSGPAVTREQALQALMAAGYDVGTVDDARLRELVSDSRAAPVSVPLQAILAE
jgi:murein L,D-transpeptidase YcbB/YkuD